MHTKITKGKIDATVAEAKDVWLWDTGVRGFGIRCRKRTAKGQPGSKTYVLKHGTGNNQQWIKIGLHGSPWTVDGARKEAIRLLGQFVAGQNPAYSREEAKRDLTISQLCDLYLNEGCAHKNPTTIEIDTGRIKRHIEPLLGKKTGWPG